MPACSVPWNEDGSRGARMGRARGRRDNAMLLRGGEKGRLINQPFDNGKTCARSGLLRNAILYVDFVFFFIPKFPKIPDFGRSKIAKLRSVSQFFVRGAEILEIRFFPTF